MNSRQNTKAGSFNDSSGYIMDPLLARMSGQLERLRKGVREMEDEMKRGEEWKAEDGPLQLDDGNPVKWILSSMRISEICLEVAVNLDREVYELRRKIHQLKSNP